MLMVQGLLMPPSVIRMGSLQIKGISLPRSYHVLLGHVHLSWHCCTSIFPRPLVHLRCTGPGAVVLEMEMVEGAGTVVRPGAGEVVMKVAEAGASQRLTDSYMNLRFYSPIKGG